MKFLMALWVLSLSGCAGNRAFVPHVPRYAASALEAAAPASDQVAELLLFGGRDHKIFLGCATCSKYDASSILNEYGDHGSRYADASIWNPYGSYGSKYSDESPWNPYAAYPPVVVDSSGNFYGYLTVNRFNPEQTRIRSLLELLAAGGPK